MNFRKVISRVLTIFLIPGYFALANPSIAADEYGDHEEEQSVKLNPDQIKAAGIVSKAIQLQNITDVINAPGEIVLNAYRTTSVTPRMSAQVVNRHAKLGDSITVGRPLLTLSSVEMASAQGDLLITEREWKRVKKLGKEVVSAQRGHRRHR